MTTELNPATSPARPDPATTLGAVDSHVLIWTGPVSAMQIKASVPPGARLVNVACTGNSPDPQGLCSAIADGWGNKLEKLRQLAKRAPGEPLDAALAGFSAGGQIVKRTLLDDAARAELAGVLLADAMYETEWLEKPKSPTDPGVGHHVEGFVRFALDATKDGRPMLATASSSPNVGPSTGNVMPSAAAVMVGTVREIERRAGRAMADATDDPTWLRLEHPPVRAWRLGSVLFGDFGDRYKHGEHATIVAGELWPQFFEARRLERTPKKPEPPMTEQTASSPTTSSPSPSPISLLDRLWQWIRSLLSSAPTLPAAVLEHAAPVWTSTPPVPDGWSRYHGARPEILGYPERTILAMPGLVKQPPEVRAKLLEVAERLRIPVDTLAVVIQSESAWDSAAPRQKTGLPRGGLVQLTKGANLPGYDSDEDVWAVRDMPATEQLERIVIPLWGRIPEDRRGDALTPGRGWMRNFLPADADRGVDFILGDGRQEPPSKDQDSSPEAKEKRWRWSIYQHNKGLDRAKRGFFTIDDVMGVSASVAKKAGGKRITVDGQILTPPGSSPAPAPAAPPSTAPPPPARPMSVAEQSAQAEAMPKVTASRTLDTAPSTAPAVPAPPEPTDSAPVPLEEAIRGPGSSASSASSRSSAPGNVDPSKPSRGLLLEAVKAGTYEKPTWVEIPWRDLLVKVGRDMLRAPVEGRLLRLPCSYLEHLEIARRLGWVMGTPDLLDAIYMAATCKLQPAPQGNWPPPGMPEAEAKKLVEETSRQQGLMGYVLKMNAKVDEQIGQCPDSTLIADPAKDWALFPRKLEPHAKDPLKNGVQNYGWHTGPVTNRYLLKGGLKQPLGPADKSAPHDKNHSDYSQALRPILRAAKRASDGAPVDLLDYFETLPLEIGAPRELTALLR
jgi:hypothetical protein